MIDFHVRIIAEFGKCYFYLINNFEIQHKILEYKRITQVLIIFILSRYKFGFLSMLLISYFIIFILEDV